MVEKFLKYDEIYKERLEQEIKSLEGLNDTLYYHKVNLDEIIKIIHQVLVIESRILELKRFVKEIRALIEAETDKHTLPVYGANLGAYLEEIEELVINLLELEIELEGAYKASLLTKKAPNNLSQLEQSDFEDLAGRT